MKNNETMLSIQDIRNEFIDKLDNMLCSEISEGVYDLISENEEYQESIIEEVKKLNDAEYHYTVESEQEAEAKEDWDSTIYNCDEIYMRAIEAALNKEEELVYNPGCGYGEIELLSEMDEDDY